ncbi:uncharacterized protein LOC111321564 [Stylophora pistillata]|uniref:uncharacterized protein LOC111321564 n=1 Tax=Stylophora pistillata TaxID=50429 RepID=UPI000C03E22D|nr:uncharacterized protein LOC111321564 [Stylophora pistillata]
MATMDEKLQQARRNIKELEDGLNFSFVKNETKEDSQSEPKTFNGKAYFELQPSWFDTLSNNAGCLNVKNFPVTAKDLEVLKNAKSSSSEPAEGNGYFDTRPSWFDTPSNNAGCLEIENFPVKAKDLEAMKKAQSNSKLFIKPAQGKKKETCEIRLLDNLHLCESGVV